MTGRILFWSAGNVGGAAKADSLRGALTTDAGTAFTAFLTSKAFLPGGGWRRASVQSPIVEGECESGVTPTVALIADYGRETRSAATPSLAASGSETRKAVVVESLEATDLQAVQIKVTWDSDQTKAIDAVTVPYRVQEFL